MSKNKYTTVEIILSAIALVLLTSIFLKAFLDMDTNYDVGWYHLPFSARIWGIIPESSFIAGTKVEDRYDGFPLLAHFFQGLLWKITGRVQTTNLVGYFSLVIYFFFLRAFFRIPLYLSSIAILAIPAVLTHAPTSFVDLPGNIAASVALMMLYRFFNKPTLPNKKELLVFFVGAAFAANTKPQLIILIALVWFVASVRLFSLYRARSKTKSHKSVSFTHIIIISTILSSLIFATTIKNTLLHGNPLYPVKIEIAGIVLNYRATPKTYEEANRPQKWLRSILEIDTPKWSADQFNRTNDPKLLDRAGGFFGAYVIFNLLLLVILAIREKISANTSAFTAFATTNASNALVCIVFLSLFTSNFPQSHELRYFMAWMIVLVSLNLDILSSLKMRGEKGFKLKYYGLPYLFFLVIVCSRIENYYLKPDFRSLDMYLHNNIDMALIDRFVPGEQNCLISRYQDNPGVSVAVQHAFYYSAYFHSDAKAKYSITIKENSEKCKSLNIVP